MKAVCIKDFKFPAIHYVKGEIYTYQTYLVEGIIIVYHGAVNQFGQTVMFRKFTKKEFKEYFINQAEWRDKQIDDILK